MAGLVFLASGPADWLDTSDKLASVAGLMVGALSLAVGLLAVLVGRKPVPPVSPEDRLAVLVRRQWAAEATARMLDRPRPLRIRWASTARPVSATPAEILGDVVPGRPTRLHLTGDVRDLADVLTRLPMRQVVVLGAPGAGKSMMLLILTLELLALRKTDDPVPVLLALPSWQPGEHLNGWLIRRLIEDYPALGNRATIETLVAHGRILPLLDGLDELPPTRRIDVFDHLNTTFGGGGAFVLSCRTDDFEATTGSRGMPLARAAVIELQGARAEDVIAFLSAGQINGGRRWAAVADEIRTRPDGTLGRVLATPLNAYLARAAYGQPSRNPTDLANTASHSSIRQTEQHLLAGYLPAIYPSGKEVRWLRVLARHLDRSGQQNITWWSLRDLIGNWSLVASLAYAAVALLGYRLCFISNELSDGIAYLAEGWETCSYLACLAFGCLGGRLIGGHARRGRACTALTKLRDMLAIGGIAAGVAFWLDLIFVITGEMRVRDIVVSGLGMALGFFIVAHIDCGGIFFWVPLLAAVSIVATIGSPVEEFKGYYACVVAVILVLLRFSSYIRSHDCLCSAIVAGMAAGMAAAISSPLGAMLAGGFVGFFVFFYLRIVRGRSSLAVGGKVSKFGLLKLGRVIIAGTFFTAVMTVLFAALGLGWRLTTVVPFGMFYGYPLYVVIGLVGALGTSGSDLLIVMPRTGLKRDRHVLIAAILAAAGMAVALGTLGTVGHSFTYGLMFIIILVISSASRWPSFALARFVLAVTRRLPWRLLYFLEDAHRRGVLRQVGAVYQFRHERLQSHLAQDDSSESSDPFKPGTT
ncbi:hypothetical protein J2S43_001028 [Catenuloplanes nepalensis]|uniref:NACHT domain-containing protein n=1 Tax=Catenuloplanes nepalensis TaxID=587533 RepID=A0ABT9MN85_9ACTN|nr:hypothetical protein [Catenuloplanes nepalensis]MDP9792516.1 hypothetical protein [Catenuloplanes nepalensis]